ncbi:hypothetical protein [Demetria terragena]|uniref:hypothetical protein n=1 Tax=Demetria terragena TaxID=63959 RepID=UPI000361B302|nr:hypothetical protein [Demetria terragena]
MTLTHSPARSTLLDADQLLRTTELLARDRDLLRHLDPSSPERSWHRLESTDALEVWLIGWPAGTSTGWHDHVGSRGAFRTVLGTLTESTWAGGGPRERELSEGSGRSFGAKHIHDVVNRSGSFAASIHAYAPALRGMNRYVIEQERLVLLGVDEGDSW